MSSQENNERFGKSAKERATKNSKNKVEWPSMGKKTDKFSFIHQKKTGVDRDHLKKVESPVKN